MGQTFYFQWEVDLMVWLQQFMSSGALLAAKTLTLIGSQVIMVAIVVTFYWGTDKKLGVFIGTNAVIGLTLASQIKNLVFRRRPYFDNESISCLSPVDSTGDLYSVEAQGFSFPSMHSANAVSVFGSIAIWFKKTWLTVCMLLLSFGIGLSRVCVGVHYPTDVLCGWGIGLVVLLVVPWLQKKVTKRWHIYLGLLLISLPGVFFAQTNDYYNSLGVMVGFFAGVLFEEKWVHFENTKNIGHIICRVVIGLLIFGVIYLLFGWLESGFLSGASGGGQFAFRFIKYAVGIFVLIGPYPMLFKKFKFLR